MLVFNTKSECFSCAHEMSSSSLGLKLFSNETQCLSHHATTFIWCSVAVSCLSSRRRTQCDLSQDRHLLKFQMALNCQSISDLVCRFLICISEPSASLHVVHRQSHDETGGDTQGPVTPGRLSRINHSSFSAAGPESPSRGYQM